MVPILFMSGARSISDCPEAYQMRRMSGRPALLRRSDHVGNQGNSRGRAAHRPHVAGGRQGRRHRRGERADRHRGRARIPVPFPTSTARPNDFHDRVGRVDRKRSVAPCWTRDSEEANASERAEIRHFAARNTRQAGHHHGPTERLLPTVSVRSCRYLAGQFRPASPIDVVWQAPLIRMHAASCVLIPARPNVYCGSAPPPDRNPCVTACRKFSIRAGQTDKNVVKSVG